MKIAIIGYGKMGHAIERIARERGHEIVSIIDVDNVTDMAGDAFRSARVAIEFTTPSTAVENVKKAAEAGLKVVCGSTGWYDMMPEVERTIARTSSALLAASNFSIGVHVFNNISRRLAHIMNNLPQYTPSMTETHHIHKLDHPSGTALTIAGGIIDEVERVKEWTDAGVIWRNASADEQGRQMDDHLERSSRVRPDQLPILTLREGEVPGIHEVRWDSPVDEIVISHSAHSRDGFALGAVMAAEWLADKTGVHSIDEMMAEILA